jgi:hypothetical protein
MLRYSTSVNKPQSFPTLPTLRKRAAKSPTYENLINLESGLRRTARLAEAHGVLEKALRLNPQQPAGWVNAAQLYSDLGNFAEVPSLFQRALQCFEKQGLAPTMAKDTLLGFAYSMMRLGQFKYAWPVWEGARVGVSWHPFPHTYPWRGEPVKKLVVLPEGGYGDGFLFSRWLPLLAQRVPEVVFIVWDRLYEYMAHVAGRYVRVFPMSHEWRYAELSEYTHSTSLMSLPAELGMESWADIPPSIDWTPPAHIIHPPLNWIGYCWWAEENGSQRRIRSLDQMTADRVGKALAKRCERVVSLVPEQQRLYEQQTALRCPKGVTQDEALLDGWEQTARTILKCRLVVSTDTAVAHLAGTLGVPTLLLQPVRRDWKWGLSGVNLPPWYGSTFREFTNDDPEGWNGDALLKVLQSY